MQLSLIYRWAAFFAFKTYKLQDKIRAKNTNSDLQKKIRQNSSLH